MTPRTCQPTKVWFANTVGIRGSGTVRRNAQSVSSFAPSNAGRCSTSLCSITCACLLPERSPAHQLDPQLARLHPRLGLDRQAAGDSPAVGHARRVQRQANGDVAIGSAGGDLVQQWQAVQWVNIRPAEHHQFLLAVGRATPAPDSPAIRHPLATSRPGLISSPTVPTRCARTSP